VQHRFEVINLERDFETCTRFRRDSYFISFGSYSEFESESNSYKDRMTERLGYLPQGNCHLWFQDRIIGQTEMKLVADADVGYISLLYLVPEQRGKGLGELLHKHAIKVFSALGKSTIQLSVSKSNRQALSFYAKHGWRNLGPRPDKETMFLMSCDLAGASKGGVPTVSKLGSEQTSSMVAREFAGSD